MWMVRTIAMSAAVLGASVLTEDARATPGGQASPVPGSEMTPAQAAKVIGFFDQLLDTMRANTADCGKMATAIDALVDANVATLREIKAHEDAGRRLPPDMEAKLGERTAKDGPAIEKCVSQPGVQAAMKRLADPSLPPAPSAAVLAAVSPPSVDDLAKYTKGIGGTGDLIATIKTPLGTIKCKLLTETAPMTVANFVGLATGKKPWLDPKTNKVRKNKRFYDGLTFHRVIPDFMIQGGDPMGSGVGGPGYTFGDETSLAVKMGPGVLAMANSGPSTNGSQFFITEGSPSYLDGKHTIFGTCTPMPVIGKIARVKTSSNDAPASPVTMKVTIRRGKL